MKESLFHNKVTWFSFLFSLLVIWVHSYNAELYLGATAWMEPVSQFEYLIGNGLAQIAVPGFFMISGYLFYRNFDRSKLWEKWNRRIRSVLVPYILWNFLYYLGYVIGSRLPWMRDVVGKGEIPFRLDIAVDAVINYTYNYVFWYLFQLILLILMAPVLYPILRRLWSRCVFFLVLGGILWRDIRIPFLNADALLYYSVAAAFALTGSRAVEEPERYLEGTLKCLVGGGMLVMALSAYQSGLEYVRPVGFVLCRLLAVTGLWVLIPAEKLPKARAFMQYNFFLYATHFGLVRFLNKSGAKLFSRMPDAPEVLHVGLPVALYLLMPALILVISSAAAFVMRRLMPRTWNLLNGGR